MVLVVAWYWTRVPHKATHISAYLRTQMTLVGWNVIQLIYYSTEAETIYVAMQKGDTEQLRQLERLVMVVIGVICVTLVLAVLGPCLVWCLSGYCVHEALSQDTQDMEAEEGS